MDLTSLRIENFVDLLRAPVEAAIFGWTIEATTMLAKMISKSTNWDVIPFFDFSQLRRHVEGAPVNLIFSHNHDDSHRPEPLDFGKQLLERRRPGTFGPGPLLLLRTSYHLPDSRGLAGKVCDAISETELLHPRDILVVSVIMVWNAFNWDRGEQQRIIRIPNSFIAAKPDGTFFDRQAAPTIDGADIVQLLNDFAFSKWRASWSENT